MLSLRKRDKSSPVNKCLHFEDMESPSSSSSSGSNDMMMMLTSPSSSSSASTTSAATAATASSSVRPIIAGGRRKLKLSSSTPAPRAKRLNNAKRLPSPMMQFKMTDLNSSGEIGVTDFMSPARTRSGRVYDINRNKNNKNNNNRERAPSRATPSTTQITVTETATCSAAKTDGESNNKTMTTTTTSTAKKPLISIPKPVFGPGFDDDNVNESPKFSPINTFSTPPESPTKRRRRSSDDDSSQEHPILIVTGFEDEENSPPRTCAVPPPLNYARRPISRISGLHNSNINNQQNSSHSSESSLNMTPDFSLSSRRRRETMIDSSPPTNGVMSLCLFDHSPVSVPPKKSNSIMSNNLSPAPHQRSRVASGVVKPTLLIEKKPLRLPMTASRSEPKRRLEKSRLANINPFTPNAIPVAMRKRTRSQQLHGGLDISNGSNFSELQKSLDQLSDDISDDNDMQDSSEPPLAKRVRVSDIHISRYNKEFVELHVIASGEYGCVRVARHCLDGMVYAVKVTKKVIQPNSHEEHVAMNEVFAHAALMKHKHVVRYYNSWVENCQVYIQTEYCEGGSLDAQIKAYRKRNRKFPESELKTIVTHICKGLSYIHSKDLVHLDIKPANIFIALEYPSASANSSTTSSTSTKSGNADAGGNVSTDSGTHSGNDNNNVSTLHGDERLTYKIGDLGHIAQIHGDYIPEEGDCRYMAPELLNVDVDRENLPKADMFSLGLTIYEAASLTELPKNSMDDPVMYDRIKRGELPYLEGYSKEFNQMIKSMVSPDPVMRPSPSKFAHSNAFQSSSAFSIKSRSQLCKELKDTRAKLRQLEELMVGQQNQNLGSGCSSPISTPTTTKLLSPKAFSASTKGNSWTKRSLVSANPRKLLVGGGTPRSSSCIL